MIQSQILKSFYGSSIEGFPNWMFFQVEKVSDLYTLSSEKDANIVNRNNIGHNLRSA